MNISFGISSLDGLTRLSVYTTYKAKIVYWALKLIILVHGVSQFVCSFPCLFLYMSFLTWYLLNKDIYSIIINGDIGFVAIRILIPLALVYILENFLQYYLYSAVVLGLLLIYFAIYLKRTRRVYHNIILLNYRDTCHIRLGHDITGDLIRSTNIPVSDHDFNRLAQYLSDGHSTILCESILLTFWISIRYWLLFDTLPNIVHKPASAKTFCVAFSGCYYWHPPYKQIFLLLLKLAFRLRNAVSLLVPSIMMFTAPYIIPFDADTLQIVLLLSKTTGFWVIWDYALPLFMGDDTWSTHVYNTSFKKIFKSKQMLSACLNLSSIALFLSSIDNIHLVALLIYYFCWVYNQNKLRKIWTRFLERHTTTVISDVDSSSHVGTSISSNSHHYLAIFATALILIGGSWRSFCFTLTGFATLIYRDMPDLDIPGYLYKKVQSVSLMHNSDNLISLEWAPEHVGYAVIEADIIRVFSYGTRGDERPFLYVVKMLNRMGIRARLHMPIPLISGDHELELLEHENCFTSLHSIDMLEQKCKEMVALGAHVISTSYINYGAQNCTTIRMYNSDVMYYPSTGIAALDYLARLTTPTTLSTAVFSQYIEGIPFSGDGVLPLRRRNLLWDKIALSVATCLPETIRNRMLLWLSTFDIYPRKGTLLATGSSQEVYDIDWEAVDTVHISCNQIYKCHDKPIEPDVNHVVCFKKYDTVISHGGNGTVKTAQNAGCKVISLSRKIDRTIRPSIKQFNHHTWDYSLTSAMATNNIMSVIDPTNSVINSMTVVTLTLLTKMLEFPVRAILKYIAVLIYLAIMNWNLLQTLITRLGPALIIPRVGNSSTSVIEVMAVMIAISIMSQGEIMTEGCVLSMLYAQPWGLGGRVFLLINMARILVSRVILSSTNFIRHCCYYVPLKGDYKYKDGLELWIRPTHGLFSHTALYADGILYDSEVIVLKHDSIGFPMIRRSIVKNPDVTKYTRYYCGPYSMPQHLQDLWADGWNDYGIANNCLDISAQALNSIDPDNPALLHLRVLMYWSYPTIILVDIANWILQRLNLRKKQVTVLKFGRPDIFLEGVVESIQRRNNCTSIELQFLIYNCISVNNLCNITRLKSVKTIKEALATSRSDDPQHMRMLLYLTELFEKSSINKIERMAKSVTTNFRKTQAEFYLAHLPRQETILTGEDFDALLERLDSLGGPESFEFPVDKAPSEIFLRRLLTFLHESDELYNIPEWAVPYILLPENLPGRFNVDQVQIYDTLMKTFDLRIIYQVDKLTPYWLAVLTNLNVTMYIRDGNGQISIYASSLNSGSMTKGSINMLKTENNKLYLIDMDGMRRSKAPKVEANEQPKPNNYYAIHTGHPTWGAHIRQTVAYWPQVIVDYYQSNEFHASLRGFTARLLLNTGGWSDRILSMPFLLCDFLFRAYFRIIESKYNIRTRIKPGIPIGTNNQDFGIAPEYVKTLGYHDSPVAASWRDLPDMNDAIVQPRHFAYAGRTLTTDDMNDMHLLRCGELLSRHSLMLRPDPDYVRHVNRNPYIDDWVSRRAALAYSLLDADEGVNSAVYATPEVTAISLQRYGKTPTKHQITSPDIENYSAAMRSKYSDHYNDFYLLNPNTALKKVKGKMGPGYGLEGAVNSDGVAKVRRRNDIYRDKDCKKILLEMVKDDIRSEFLFPIIHSSFPKDYKDFKAKLEENPLKARTIVAPDLISLIADKTIFHTIDKKAASTWQTSDASLGLPWKGLALTETLNRMIPARQRIGYDLSEFDSTHSTYVPDLLSNLYGPGFTSLTPSGREIIARQIKSRWERYMNCGLIKDMNHGGFHHKVRGSTTGSVSVTRTNIEVAKFALTHSIHLLTGMSYQEVLDRTDREVMGDDGLLQFIDFTVNTNELVRIMQDHCGLKLKIEFESIGSFGRPTATWAGCKYLSHNILPVDSVRDELLEAGIPEDSPVYPQYVLQYLPERWRMRQTVALRKANIFKQYESAYSYMQKTLHSKQNYTMITGFMQELKIKILQRPNGRKFLQKRPILTYNELLRKFYTDAYRLLQYERSLPDYYAGFVNTTNLVYISMINVISGLRSSCIEGLGSTRIGAGTSGLFNTRAFIVEKFVYMMCREQSQKGLVDFDNYSRMLGSNPFSSCTFPEEGYQIASKIKWTPLKEWRVHAHYQWLQLVFLSLRECIKISVYSNPIISFANAMYTLCFGMPRAWWGLSSSISVLSTGSPNSKVAQLIAKDPFYMSKNVAHLVTSCIPPYVTVCGLPRELFGMLDNLITGFLVWITVKDPLVTDEILRGTPAHNTAWEVFYNTDVLPRLVNGLYFAVHAPTGSGKSRDLSTLLRMNYERVFYIEPRNSIAISMAGFVFIKKGTPIPEHAGKFTITGGYLCNVLRSPQKLEALRGAIFIWDEYDERDPASIMAVYRLKQNDISVMAVSATADPGLLNALGFDMNTGYRPILQSQFNVTTEIMTRGSSIVRTVLINAERFRQILVILPTIKECEALAVELEALDMDCGVYSSEHSLPNAKVIVATQIVEKGITLPLLECVIDSGEMLRNHLGKLIRMPIDNATMEQRRGRVGRTRDGHYILMKRATGESPVPYPSGFVLLDNWNTVKMIYRVFEDLLVFPHEEGFHNLHGYVNLDMNRLIDIDCPEAVKVAVGAIMLTTESRRAVHETVRIIMTEADNTEMSFLVERYRNSFRTLILSPLADIERKIDAMIDHNPLTFLTSEGVEHGHCIRLFNGHIVFSHDIVHHYNSILSSTVIIPRIEFGCVDSDLPLNATILECQYLKYSSNHWADHFAGNVMAMLHRDEVLIDNDEIRDMKDLLGLELNITDRSDELVLSIIHKCSYIMKSHILWGNHKRRNARYEWVLITGQNPINGTRTMIKTSNNNLWWIKQDAKVDVLVVEQRSGLPMPTIEVPYTIRSKNTHTPLPATLEEMIIPLGNPTNRWCGLASAVNCMRASCLISHTVLNSINCRTGGDYVDYGQLRSAEEAFAMRDYLAKIATAIFNEEVPVIGEVLSAAFGVVHPTHKVPFSWHRLEIDPAAARILPLLMCEGALGNGRIEGLAYLPAIYRPNDIALNCHISTTDHPNWPVELKCKDLDDYILTGGIIHKINHYASVFKLEDTWFYVTDDRIHRFRPVKEWTVVTAYFTKPYARQVSTRNNITNYRTSTKETEIDIEYDRVLQELFEDALGNECLPWYVEETESLTPIELTKWDPSMIMRMKVVKLKSDGITCIEKANDELAKRFQLFDCELNSDVSKPWVKLLHQLELIETRHRILIIVYNLVEAPHALTLMTIKNGTFANCKRLQHRQGIVIVFYRNHIFLLSDETASTSDIIPCNLREKPLIAKLPMKWAIIPEIPDGKSVTPDHRQFELQDRLTVNDFKRQSELPMKEKERLLFIKSCVDSNWNRNCLLNSKNTMDNCLRCQKLVGLCIMMDTSLTIMTNSDQEDVLLLNCGGSQELYVYARQETGHDGVCKLTEQITTDVKLTKPKIYTNLTDIDMIYYEQTNFRQVRFRHRNISYLFDTESLCDMSTQHTISVINTYKFGIYPKLTYIIYDVAKWIGIKAGKSSFVCPIDTNAAEQEKRLCCWLSRQTYRFATEHLLKRHDAVAEALKDKYPLYKDPHHTSGSAARIKLRNLRKYISQEN